MIGHCHMTRSVHVAIILSLLIAWLPIAGSRAEQRVGADSGMPSVIYGADRNFPPWEWVSEDGVLQGFNIELVREIAWSAGFNVRFVHSNWSDIRQRQWNGEIDLTAMFISRERKASLNFSAPIALGYDTIWIRDGDPEINLLSDLSGKTVVVQQNGFAAEFFTQTDPTVKLIPVETEPDALKVLSEGRGDCAILSEQTALASIDSLGLDNIVETGNPVLPRPLAFAATPDKASLLDQINEQMMLMRADGRWAELERNWLQDRGHRTWIHDFLGRWGWVLLIGTIATLAWLLVWTLVLRRRIAVRTAELEEELANHELTEDELRRSGEVVNILFNSSPVMLSLSRFADGRFVEINPAVTRITGYPRDQILGKTSLELGLWANPADRDRIVAQVNTTGSCHYTQVSVRLKSGKTIECVLNAEAVEIDGDTLLLTAINDVSSLKAAEREKARLENQLRNIQKIEMAGRLAGGVAHDFNNQLTIIQGYCDVLARRLTSSNDAAVLEEIRQAVRHSASLTSSLLAFSRKQVRRLEVLNPTVLIGQTEQALRAALGENIELIIDGRAPEALVEFDRGQFVEVIYNIVTNAKDAMGSSGRLEIRVEAETIAAGYYVTTVEVNPGDYVVVSIQDDGIGMDEDTQRMIFEPFFTTKEVGKGIGLGMSTVYGIVKQNGGYIDVISSPGQGTTMRMLFPAFKSAGELAGEQPRQECGRRGTETVLLVEDEKGLFQLLTEVLLSCGYRVLASERPLAALELARNEKPDIVVTDVVMPEMSGRDLVAQVRQTYPDIKVLYMSGYPRDTITAHGILGSDVDLLNKPFTLDEFQVVIRRILDS